MLIILTDVLSQPMELLCDNIFTGNNSQNFRLPSGNNIWGADDILHFLEKFNCVLDIPLKNARKYLRPAKGIIIYQGLFGYLASEILYPREFGHYIDARRVLSIVKDLLSVYNSASLDKWDQLFFFVWDHTNGTTKR